MSSFAGTDEEDMAGAQIRSPPHPSDNQWPAIDYPAVDCLIERGAKRVGPHHPNDQRGAVVGKRFAWPINKLRKVVKEGRLDLIFISRLGLYRAVKRGAELTENKENAHNHSQA
jgi:hypothetical protein